MSNQHPIQPIEIANDGVVRFKANEIIKLLIDTEIIDLNKIATMDFSDDDRAQLAQLGGYSVSGFSGLSYVSNELANKCSEEAARVWEARPKS